jgi:hypothetical protein
VGNGSGLSRGDRNRNARLARLRELVPHGNAIVGIDLAEFAEDVPDVLFDGPLGNHQDPGDRGVGAAARPSVRARRVPWR